jgi:hypothetical protein
MKRTIFLAVGMFSILVSLTQSVFAAWDKPCDKRQILEAYWCDTCKEVREFNECAEIGYICFGQLFHYPLLVSYLSNVTRGLKL